MPNITHCTFTEIPLNGYNASLAHNTPVKGNKELQLPVENQFYRVTVS